MIHINLSTLNTGLLNATAVLSGILVFLNLFVIYDKNKFHKMTLAFIAPMVIIIFSGLLKVNYTYFEISIVSNTLLALLLTVNISLKDTTKDENILEINLLVSAVLFIALQMLQIDFTERNLIFILVGLSLAFFLYAFYTIQKTDKNAATLLLFLPLASILFVIPQINSTLYWGNLIMVVAIYRILKYVYKDYKDNFNAIHFEYENLKDSYERAVIQEAKKRTYYMERSKEKMAEISRTDHLTKALNKKAILDTIDRLSENRGQRKFAVLMFDIDNFKTLNDTYGHVTGDVCLKNLSNIVRLNKRDEDYFGRYGGDEFIIVLPSVNLETALKIGERYRRGIEKTTNPHFTVSMGIACYPEDAKTTKSLLEVADKGLYRSKEKGRNAVSHGG